MERCLVLWFPDWPVTARLRSREAPLDPAAPIALIAGHTVVACSAAARRDGIRRGMRQRDAQSRCPGLRIVPDDPARDAREFLPVADRIEHASPGLQLLRPGLCALRIRGPARYYGGERPAALALLAILHEEGLEARAGIADDRFTAEQAARRAGPAAGRPGAVLVVPPGGSRAFLQPLPVAALDDAALAELLGQLGVTTLGGFAALGAAEVLDRLGPEGALRHALAAGRDPRRFLAREAARDHARELAFEPPLELAEQVAFGIRTTAEACIAGLAAAGLACTELRVTLRGPDGDGVERVWAHQSSFDAAAVVDRVRWQLEGAASGALPGGVDLVRLAPEAVGRIAAYEPGLFGRGADGRIGNALSRVQTMLGPQSVLVASVGGGRRLADRITLTPWGERPPPAPTDGRDGERPWPGTLPEPHPPSVYPVPVPVQVESRIGTPVRVGDRGALFGEPGWIHADGARQRITAWAGPWPAVERGWDPTQTRRCHRFQVVDEAGRAWALLLERGEWSAEGRYD